MTLSQKWNFNVSLTALAFAGCVIPSAVFAQESVADNSLASSEIIVTGTRRADRSVVESSVPVDVVSSKDLSSVASSNVQDKLAQTVPSFTVQTKPLYGAIMFIRPATLRGLTPDDTLVLVNGKRQHRSAYVNFNILSGGAQGVDLSQIPSAALGRVEVLRDGASAQYGSDAIAGVINLILDDKPGYNGYIQAGEYYAGDGFNFQAAANAGWALGDRGNFNASFEYTNGKETSRTLQREEATALIAAGNTNVRQPGVTTWGQPELELYRVTYTGKYDISDSAELYSFGLYGHSWGRANVNWRSPNGSSFVRSVFQDPPYNIFPTYDPKSRYPGGVTPFLETTGIDLQLAAGVRGDINDSMTYDASVNWGKNKTSYRVTNSINPSFGPLSTTEFNNGNAQTSELDINLDFVYSLEAGLETPINIAFGGEFRREDFKLTAGELMSYAVGPFADLPGGAGGSGGISPSAEGKWDRHSFAAYVDVDADLSSALNVGVAGRFENYSDFGSTINGKFSTRYEFSPAIAIRGSVSTGFRAPTPGQSFTTNVSTSPDPNNPGQIFFQTLIPATDPIAVAFGAKPLEAEKSVDFTGGIVLQPVRGMTITADYYNILVKDRLTTSQLFGTNPNRYNFFVNGYKTRTQGIDVVASYRMAAGAGTMMFTGAFNYNSTKVLSFLPGVISSSQELALERKLPRYTGTMTVDYVQDEFELTLRGRYFGSLVDLFFDADAFSQRISPIFFVDLSASYNVTPNVKVTLGAENLFDTHPDKVNWGGPLSSTNFLDFGRIYPSALPYGFEGGRYYGRVSFNF